MLVDAVDLLARAHCSGTIADDVESDLADSIHRCVVGAHIAEVLRHRHGAHVKRRGPVKRDREQAVLPYYSPP